LLFHLGRRGQVIYDVERREYRSRELFAVPVDEARLFPPDPRRERAWDLVKRGEVCVARCGPKETRKTRTLPTPDGRVTKEIIYRDWQVSGLAGDQAAVEVVVKDGGQIIFGTCGCAFFKDHLLNQGPCEHMLAVLAASEPLRRDLPTSQPAAGA